MRRRSLRRKRALMLGLVLLALLAVAGIIGAQPPVPHAVMESDDCLGCHQAGVAGAPRVAWDHLGRSNQDCEHCHQVSGAPAGEIPHPVFGRDDCLACHREGIGSTPRLTGNHVSYSSDQCRDCHNLSAAAREPTPIPSPTPAPTPLPGAVHVPASAETCIACHQLIFADAQHTLFTGQPVGDSLAGKTLFDQSCAVCHGLDGTTPVGSQGTIVNSEAYWGTHDDASILRDIGAGSHGQMAAFAEEYGGPLAWDQILDLAALVRSWGPFSGQAVSPAGQPAGPTYTADIRPILTQTCGPCHGGSAGLTVTSYGSLMAGSASGPVVAPGDPEASRIVQVQRGPHYGQLSDPELKLLIEWINAGAPE